MTWYTCIILITVLLMVAMILHVVFYSGFTRQQKFWYILTFGAIAFCSFAEFLVHGITYNENLRVILYLATVLQFSIAPMLGVFFTGALGLHKQAKIASFIFLVNFAVEILCAPFGWIFYFGADGYHRGAYFDIYTAFYVVSLVYLIVCMVIVGKRFRHRDASTIIMIIVVLVAGIVPMAIYKLNITYIAIGISACLCYIYYNDLVQQDIQADYVANQEKITSMQEHIISGLANLIENRDSETGEHITRTSAYVRILAEDCLKDGVYTDIINDHFIALLQTLAPMHDMGKIVVSDKILKKPGKLTDEEYEQMKKHAAVGGNVVRDVLNGITDEEYLSFASDIATYHHEKWNGSGYPNGLKGEEIPLSARIMAIADVFDALVSKRCYKEPIPVDDSIEIMKAGSGSHFDPKLIEVFLNHKEDFIEATKGKDVIENQ